ncbi:MAG: hypothetical protein AAB453_03240 [Patescibacteria group bacterium]
MLLAPKKVTGVKDSTNGERFELRFFGLKEIQRGKNPYSTNIHRGLEWCVVNNPFGLRPLHPAPNTMSDRTMLEVESKIQKRGGRLCIFCSVGTEIDYNRGIDGFFTWDNWDCVAHVVTFDLTSFDFDRSNNGYKSKFLADLLIVEGDLDDTFLFNQLAKQIARQIDNPKAVHYLPSLAEIK